MSARRSWIAILPAPMPLSDLVRFLSAAPKKPRLTLPRPCASVRAIRGPTLGCSPRAWRRTTSADTKKPSRGVGGQSRPTEIIRCVRAPLSLMHGATTSRALVARLLDAMKAGARPVKPKDLGIIGREHLLNRFIATGIQEDSFDYQVNAFEHDGLPYVIEVAFA